ncbi:MAG: hypothetical protein IJ446_01305 [Oscillospiraceae bacterium]|nr:hypothetical protein [Oscillospiraceae bacterium]
MKKILSLIMSAVICGTMLAVPAAAEEEKKENEGTRPTVCFDTDESFQYIHTFGSAADTGLSYEITPETTRTNRALKISQDFAGSLTSGAEASGFYFNADTFGLESFAGTELSFYVYAEATGADELYFYTDGDIYLAENVSMTATPYWQKVTIEVPENVNNTMFGVLINSSTGFNDAVCHVDDLTVKDKNGVAIENIGDYKNVEGYAAGGAASVLTIIVFVILILAVIGICVLVVIKTIKKYR